MQKELEEAAKDTRGISPDKYKEKGLMPVDFYSSALPTNAAIKFVSHSPDC